ncbi:MAG: transposase [Nanoarchaeota archaeon]
MRKRREFTRDFKLSVLSELNVKKAAEVCKEHNIHPVLLSKWKKDFNQDPFKAFNGKGNLWKAEAEVEKYKRLVGELYAEIDFLKKTTKKLQELKAEEERMKSLR